MVAMMGWGAHQRDQGWRKGPWTPEEDKLLTEYVNLHGEGRWSCVAKSAGLNRSGKSSRLRWVNYLRPGLKRGQITPQEEAIIIELHALWGNKWSTIARYLPGRTDNEIKNYWRTHFKKREKPSQKQEKRKAQMLKRGQQHQQQQQKQDNMNKVLESDHHAETSNEKVNEGQGGREDDVFPTLEDQCLPVMMCHRDIASLWSENSAIMEEGILWNDLWNLDDFHARVGVDHGSNCVETAAMQNQTTGHAFGREYYNNFYNGG